MHHQFKQPAYLLVYLFIVSFAYATESSMTTVAIRVARPIVGKKVLVNWKNKLMCFLKVILVKFIHLGYRLVFLKLEE